MPRDDWSKARNRDIARREVALRRYDRVAVKPKRTRNGNRPSGNPRPAATNVAALGPPQSSPCPRCGSTTTGQHADTIRDGRTQIRLYCDGCGRFIKWIGQREAVR